MAQINIHVIPRILKTRVVGLRGLPGDPSQEQVNIAVEEYMTEHPEAQIPDGAVLTAKIADGAVTTPKLAGGSVTEQKIADEAITTEKMASNTVAPYADNLVSSSYVSDSEPYLFRKTFAGVREDTELVGGSVVWNQLCTFTAGAGTSYGVTYTRGDDGTITVDGTATGSSYSNAGTTIHVQGHKVLLQGSPDGSSSTYYLRDGYTAGKYDIGQGLLIEAKANTVVQIVVANGVTVNNLVFKPQIFDLTLMFGPTVADYIYSLETATAGAGVAFFRSLFSKPYYAYNAGEIISVKTSAHKMVGFNQWDEEWELGGLNSNTGDNTVTTNYIRSKNYISVLPQTAYYFKTPFSIPSSSIYVYYYDANKSFLEGGRKWSATQTTPQSARYMRFFFAVSAYGSSTYNNDICVNISDPSKNATYEPYTEVTYPLSSIDLRGIPTIVDGRLKYDGDVYKSDGTVERRYGVVDLGTLNWSKDNQTNNPGRFYSSGIASLVRRPTAAVQYGAFILCSKYIAGRNPISTPKDADKMIAVYTNGTIYISDITYTESTTAEFKTAMSGVYLVYELATPTTETTDPYTNPQKCYPDGTEEYIDTREVPIPVGHNTKYMRDLKKLLEGIPDAPTANGTYVLKATVSSSGVTYSWVEG